MLKKIIGVFSLVMGVASIKNAFEKGGSMLFVVPLLIVTGVFLIMFDGVHKKSFEKGFKTRKAQVVFLNILTIVWIVLYVIALIGMVGLSLSGTEPVLLLIIGLSALITFIPGLTVMKLFDLYSKPYRMCRKYFLTNDEQIRMYLGKDEEFIKYSKNGFVFASGRGLFLRKAFCLIPFEQIASVENKKTIDGAQVRFNLKNGKCIKVLTNQYNEIMAAMNARQQCNIKF